MSTLRESINYHPNCIMFLYRCLWLECVLEELRLEYKKPVQLQVDNKSIIDLSRNSQKKQAY